MNETFITANLLRVTSKAHKIGLPAKGGIFIYLRYLKNSDCEDKSNFESGFSAFL